MVPWPTSKSVCSRVMSAACCGDWPCFSISINIVSASRSPSSISTEPCQQFITRPAACRPRVRTTKFEPYKKAGGGLKDQFSTVHLWTYRVRGARAYNGVNQSLNQNLFSEQQKYYSVLQCMLALKRLPEKHTLIKLAA